MLDLKIADSKTFKTVRLHKMTAPQNNKAMRQQAFKVLRLQNCKAMKVKNQETSFYFSACHQSQQNSHMRELLGGEYYLCI